MTSSLLVPPLAPGSAVHLTHVVGAGIAYALTKLVRTAPALVVVETEEEATALRDDLRALAPTKKSLVLPPRSENPYENTRPDARVGRARAACLARLDRRELDFLVVSAVAFTQKVPAPTLYEPHLHTLTVGQTLPVERLTRRLADAGYERLPVVEDPGVFSVRGELVDLWVPSEPAPVRVEYAFDEIARLARFSPETQRSLAEPVDGLSIVPAREVPLGGDTLAGAKARLLELCDSLGYPSKKTRQLLLDVESGRSLFGQEALLPAFASLESLTTRLPPDAPLVLVHPDRLLQRFRARAESLDRAFRAASDTPNFPPEAHALVLPELERVLVESRPRLLLHELGMAPGETAGIDALRGAPPDSASLGAEDQRTLAKSLAEARRLGGPKAGLDPLRAKLRDFVDRGYRVLISARHKLQAERLTTLLSGEKFEIRQRESLDLETRAPISIATSTLARGVVLPNEGLVLLTEEEIFGKRSHARPKTAKKALKNAIDDLRTLASGDLVVHSHHGVGRYRGLEHKEIGGVVVDLLVVEYQSKDKLLLPVYRLNQLQKLPEGAESATLDRLGGQTFEKTKSKARKKVREIADQLLRIHAERAERKRPALPPPGEDYEAFAAAFPFEETDDQAAAIADVLADLTRDTVMDRLVCGDVGFGKTEVALRAAFLCAMAGRQVAVLCPTTVLADQHFRTFEARFAESGLVVAALSRFESEKNVRKTLEGLKRGSVDVVVGTHRLLSKDVHFKNLGLLVVDEEQRFGVAHKERIKDLRATVDVLTLTATPIPRTLSFALGGLRDMSVLATPPENRRAIRTLTSLFDETLIRSAITRELDRGGQVFFVRNRVEGIEERAEQLRQLLPGVRVATGHGQMSEKVLERVMVDFAAGEYDVLVATAIVESGLDIPRANTILIERADSFGLSQLYQIRGRVGRSSERAYCYLLLPPDGTLSEEGRARIAALERYSELGAGFQIASLDLEQRGAGELLGADQSGFLGTIGFDLYVELLEQAKAELAGLPYDRAVDPELSVDVEALLPEAYVADIGVRLSLYKRFSSAEDVEEVDELGRELEDRFGDAPTSAANFVALMRLKVELRRLRALGVVATRRAVTLHLAPETKLSPSALVTLIERSRGSIALSPDGRITRKASEPLPKDGLAHTRLLLAELEGATRGS